MKTCLRNLQQPSGLYRHSLRVCLNGISTCRYRYRYALNRGRHYSSVSAAELQFGQPLHETHPHLLKAGERKTSALRYHELRIDRIHQLPQALPLLSTPGAARSSLHFCPKMALPFWQPQRLNTAQALSSMSSTRIRTSST